MAAVGGQGGGDTRQEGLGQVVAQREQITAITNKAEAFHGYAEPLMIGGRLIGHNDPDHQERVVKLNVIWC